LLNHPALDYIGKAALAEDEEIEELIKEDGRSDELMGIQPNHNGGVELVTMRKRKAFEPALHNGGDAT
jgi:hypothetical protein